MEKMAIHKPRREASEGTKPAETLILELDLQNCEDKTFLWVKPPRLWRFVRAALAN